MDEYNSLFFHVNPLPSDPPFTCPSSSFSNSPPFTSLSLLNPTLTFPFFSPKLPFSYPHLSLSLFLLLTSLHLPRLVTCPSPSTCPPLPKTPFIQRLPFQPPLHLTLQLMPPFLSFSRLPPPSTPLVCLLPLPNLSSRPLLLPPPLPFSPAPSPLPPPPLSPTPTP